MPHPFSCQCQKLQGVVLEGGTCSRVLCYCKDCQAFARYLRRQSAMLNDQGGTHLVQVAAHRVRFTRGMEHLAVVRLSPRGLLRWYASCCNTPIGNTLPSRSLAFIGLVDNLLTTHRIPKDFPGRMAVVHTHSANGSPKPVAKGLPGNIWRFIKIVATARLSGKHTTSVFFDEHGQPVVTPHVLTKEERTTLASAPAPEIIDDEQDPRP